MCEFISSEESIFSLLSALAPARAMGDAISQDTVSLHLEGRSAVNKLIEWAKGFQ